MHTLGKPREQAKLDMGSAPSQLVPQTSPGRGTGPANIKYGFCVGTTIAAAAAAASVGAAGRCKHCGQKTAGEREMQMQQTLQGHQTCFTGDIVSSEGVCHSVLKSCSSGP